MATTTAFPSLSLPAPDDTMEMSSPANRNLDDDIDIDFDDYQAGVQLTDDEHMLEDTTRPATATDEAMDDDLQPAGDEDHVVEEVMQDDVPHTQDAATVEEDEELIDYGEDEELQADLTEIAHEDVQPTTVDIVPEATFDDAAVESFDEAAERLVEAPVVQSPPAAYTEDLTATDVKNDESHVDTLDATAPETLEAGADDSLTAATLEEQQDQKYEGDEPGDAAGEIAAVDRQQISVNTSLDASTDGPATPTDTGLHPMMIRCGDLHIPLFKSRRQIDGLLKNDNLVSMSLADLIADCRTQIGVKRGEVIPDGQELVLGFDDLGLSLVEDARAASESSLNDILEVYLQLHRNDGVEEIGPLNLTLSPQLKFASGLLTFKQSAAAGRGMSAFSLLQGSGEEEADHQYYEEDGNWEEQESGEDAVHQQDQTYNESTYHDREDENEDFDHGYNEEYYTGEDQEADAEHTYDYHETAEGDYPAEDQGEAADALDGLAGHSVDDFPDNVNDQEVFNEEQDVAALADTEAETTVENHQTSRSSSRTVQGDDNIVENTFAEPHDDTTLNTEYEAIEVPKDGSGSQPNLGSEDFLNELSDELHGQQYQENESYGQETDGQEQEEQFDYTDNHIYSQHEHDEEQGDGGDYHPDYEPGEGEDEQFHTAHDDFLDGEYYEAGEEHTEAGDAIQNQEDDEEFDDTVLIHRPDAEEDPDGENEAQPRGDFKDDLNFDEDEPAEEEQLFDNIEEPADTKAVKPTSGGSPLGKRSFDEIEDFEDDIAEMPEIKKVRSS